MWDKEMIYMNKCMTSILGTWYFLYHGKKLLQDAAHDHHLSQTRLNGQPGQDSSQRGQLIIRVKRVKLWKIHSHIVTFLRIIYFCKSTHGEMCVVPRRVCSASITASSGGGSIALARKWPIAPSLSSLMLSATSCSGVRKISGVMWVSNLYDVQKNVTMECLL